MSSSMISVKSVRFVRDVLPRPGGGCANRRWLIATDAETSVKELTTLLSDLESAGLQTEVRAGYDQTLLVFVKAPRELLGNTVYKSR